MVGVALAAFTFTFAMVPLYGIACEHVLGIKLERGAADAKTVGALQVDLDRTLTVQFIATTQSQLPWQFRAEQVSLQVHPGELAEAWFEATNTSPRAIVGNAVPSVAPSSASNFFNKTECVCFTQQLLQPGETRRMPVRFVVDPKLPAGIGTLTLAYTFYENDIATAKVAQSAQQAAVVPAS
jgi:cytochrome c oxidase assembly protein subunit 11